MSGEQSILDALDMWSAWHCDASPLGATGDYALDMALADAFRALLYRPALKDRLDWLQREVGRERRRPCDRAYQAELRRWYLTLWETEKWPFIEGRSLLRGLECVSS